MIEKEKKKELSGCFQCPSEYKNNPVECMYMTADNGFGMGCQCSCKCHK